MADKKPGRMLFWTGIEVRGDKALMSGRQYWSEPGSGWPDTPRIPPALARGASFRVDASGRILYDIAKNGEMPRAAIK